MDELLHVIGRLYDAAVDPGHWPDALTQSSRFLDVAQVVVAVEDAVDPSTSFFRTSYDDTSWMARYVDHYMLMNPTRLAMTGRIQAGDTILTTDFMSAAEYGATRFAREFLTERRIVDIAVAVLEITATRISVLSAHRNEEQGFGDELLRTKLIQLLPHFQRAVRISLLLEHHQLVSSNLVETLDLLKAAIFLVTESSGIVHANAQGGAMIASADAVSSPAGKLTLFDRAAGKALEKVLKVAGRGDLSAGAEERSIIARSRDGGSFVVTVMPLSDARRRSIGSRYDAVAAVSLKQAEFEPPAALRLLETHFALTPREMTMLAAAVEFDGVPEIASVMGVTQATVKSHLKSVFRKTGATRQADLVKLAAGIAGPF